MNSKKARQIRRTMKLYGIDPHEVTYMPITTTYGVANPIRLDSFCGRAEYKSRKRAV